MATNNVLKILFLSIISFSSDFFFFFLVDGLYILFFPRIPVQSVCRLQRTTRRCPINAGLQSRGMWLDVLVVAREDSARDALLNGELNLICFGFFWLTCRIFSLFLLIYHVWPNQICRYPEMTEDVIAEACPVCRANCNCNCKACLLKSAGHKVWIGFLAYFCF